MTPAQKSPPPNSSITPSPPPTKKRKLRGPTKKTSSSKKKASSKYKQKPSPVKKTPEVKRRLPTVKNTPTTSATKPNKTRDAQAVSRSTPWSPKTILEHQPGVKNTGAIAKMFTIGRAIGEEGGTVGKVRALKMDIEKRIRQGRRWSVVEDVRKRIVTPIKPKRTRDDDGEWEAPTRSAELQHQPVTLAGQEDTPPGSHTQLEEGRGKAQTPIISFLVLQTLEERTLLLRKPAKPTGSELGNKEMSSLPALSAGSPTLRRRNSRRTGAMDVRKSMEVKKTVPKKTNTISNFLQKTEEPDRSKITSGHAYNNNQPCVRPGHTIGTNYDQEMAADPKESPRPITVQKTDHVIRKNDPEPMNSLIENDHVKLENGSHLRE